MIRKVSKKQAARLRKYKTLRDDYLEVNAFCLVKGCNCMSSEVHHMKGRIGDLLFDTRFFLPVCRAHHNYIENHPRESYEAGYSLKRLAK